MSIVENTSSSAAAIIPNGVLPAYLAEAFGDLYEEDGLICFGKGLQCLMLLAAFCRFYVDPDHASLQKGDDTRTTTQAQATTTASAAVPTPNEAKIKKRQSLPLVIVLGMKDEIERSTLLQILQSWGTPIHLLPTMITNESGQSSHRAALYRTGGIFVVTSRILIVDLLTGTLRPQDMEGVLVAHAETVTEQSTEAFILRIVQSQKLQMSGEPAFVKAFTDEPTSLTAGFAKIDKIMKALHVRRLYLYPRFHSIIRDELEVDCIVVTELHQELSKQQKEIQNAIAVLVLQCLRQLKQSTEHLVSWSNEGQEPLSVENCATQQFDAAISRQLEPFWHRLQPSTKQYVQDLRTLRTLFHALLQYDCVGFWKLLNSIRTMSAASRHPALWLLQPAADNLFRKAKERVYTIHHPAATAQIPHPVAQLVTVLEENPKWKLLRNVLKEIRDKDAKLVEEDTNSNCAAGGITNILVMVKDDKTLNTLKSYLSDDVGGTSRTLQLRWLNYLEQCNDRSRSTTESRGGSASLSEESRLLLEEEGRARRILFGRHDKPMNMSKKRALNQLPDYVRKRRRIAVEKGRGEKDQEDLDRQAVLEEAMEATEHDLEDSHHAHKKINNDDEGDDKSDKEDAHIRVSFPDYELRVVLQSYASVVGDQTHLFLQDIQPKYVVLFDADVSFIRAVEIYAALAAQDGPPLDVFFLMFEASAEEKNFKTSLEREQNAFEKLIHHKMTMPPPALQTLETQEMQQALQTGSVAGTYGGGLFPLAADTRRMKKNNKEMRDIAVDVREFRSALPNILHQGGMRLAPVTLVVGDFVLSNVHCVERKSIGDLFGSFTSGRLYTQAEAMSKYYQCPCLLIEFDPNKSFCLQNSNELGTDIRMDSICSKMVLLTMHFPKLRILWSRSPHETLKIFRALKTNHEEVDVERAMEIGRNESEEFLLQPATDEDEINEVARDMLLRLPGVNVHNARKIMAECDSLAELSEMSREELRKITGPVCGQKLFTFFRQKIAAT